MLDDETPERHHHQPQRPADGSARSGAPNPPPGGQPTGRRPPSRPPPRPHHPTSRGRTGGQPATAANVVDSRRRGRREADQGADAGPAAKKTRRAPPRRPRRQLRPQTADRAGSPEQLCATPMTRRTAAGEGPPERSRRPHATAVGKPVRRPRRRLAGRRPAAAPVGERPAVVDVAGVPGPDRSRPAAPRSRSRRLAKESTATSRRRRLRAGVRHVDSRRVAGSTRRRGTEQAGLDAVRDRAVRSRRAHRRLRRRDLAADGAPAA